MTTTVSQSLLAQISGLLARETGLNFPPDRWRDLERGIAAAASELGRPDTETFVRELSESPWTPTQVEILASHLTVGETYFFRHSDCMTALETRVLPELITARRKSERSLRIWSAGCCSGEEPYTIAMLLDRVLPDRREWNISILGTDINPHFLRTAQAGVYREWSFRETDPSIKRKYFVPVKRDAFEIHPEIKAMVRFACLNLARDPYPSFFNGIHAMDLILCRNVLMYFTPEHARAAASRLRNTLVDGGWLAVSPTEASQSLFAEFAYRSFPGAILYQKSDQTDEVIADDRSKPLYVPPPPAPPAPKPEVRKPSPAPSKPPSMPAVSRLSIDSMVQRAQTLANEGKLQEALRVCEESLAADRLHPPCHYLKAAILEESGQFEQAAVALRHTLYLAPEFVLAHFALGNLCKREHKTAEALRHFKNAVRILAGSKPTDAVPEAGGITAGRFLEILEGTIATMTGSPQ